MQQRPPIASSRQQTALATPKEIQSILKKYPSQPSATTPTAQPQTQTQPSSTPRTTQATTSKTFDDRTREIALYHAHLLQRRKDIELEILLSLEALIDYPLACPPQYSESSPSPTDAATFKHLLSPFTTSDYDALIVERNINEHCGYALCPNPRLRDKAGGAWRLLGMNGKAKDFRVVRKEELEKWCSEACARRALYVRVQLSECPAWERDASLLGSRIELLDEPQMKGEEDVITEGIERLALAGENERERDARDLALERGDRGIGAQGGLVDVKVLERDVKMKVQPPSLGEEELSARFKHLALEGYTSNFGQQRNRLLEAERDRDGDGDEMEEDTDWNL